MLESTLKFIRCPKCNSNLNIEIYKNSNEINEGILKCEKCQLEFPIIDKIPIMFIDFKKYISEHKILSEKLYKLASSNEVKKFLKLSLNNVIWNKIDKTGVEERWSQIYNINKNNEFYKIIKSYLVSIPKSKLVLEYGCSIGIITKHISDSSEKVFGIDKSFNAIHLAKKIQKNNLDYIVSDFTSTPFKNKKFDLIVGLNILELMEPNILLKQISKQISAGYIMITDPYDYERGINSVKHPINELLLRKNLRELKFKINKETEKPSFIPWNLKLYDRASLNYKVDIVIAKK
jgi:2-polyprenyl-3-methyl-5-hydroxy-6-metoxy-1,4-benzoquinol methylase/uncharacterized protein YbaR (Trm112 family)